MNFLRKTLMVLDGIAGPVFGFGAAVLIEDTRRGSFAHKTDCARNSCGGRPGARFLHVGRDALRHIRPFTDLCQRSTLWRQSLSRAGGVGYDRSMTAAIAFDTHRFVKRLTKSGFTETLAEEHVTLLNANLATKADIAAVKADIDALRQDTAVGIEALR